MKNYQSINIKILPTGKKIKEIDKNINSKFFLKIQKFKTNLIKIINLRIIFYLLIVRGF